MRIRRQEITELLKQKKKNQQLGSDGPDQNQSIRYQTIYLKVFRSERS